MTTLTQITPNRIRLFGMWLLLLMFLSGCAGMDVVSTPVPTAVQSLAVSTITIIHSTSTPATAKTLRPTPTVAGQSATEIRRSPSPSDTPTSSLIWNGPLVALYTGGISVFDFGTNEYHTLFNPVIHVEVILGWSTDGCQLAYSSEDGALWLANIHNLIRKQVISGYEAPQSEVIWSPTNEWIAYAAQSPEDISIIRPDASERVRLTQDNYVDKTAGWSSNGQEVLFWSKRDAGWELYATALPTLTTRLLTKLPSTDFLPELDIARQPVCGSSPGPAISGPSLFGHHALHRKSARVECTNCMSLICKQARADH